MFKTKQKYAAAEQTVESPTAPEQQAALSPARQALRDYLQAVADAETAAKKCGAPLARLDGKQREAAEATRALQEFESAYEESLAAWAATGRGMAPEMDLQRHSELKVAAERAGAEARAANEAMKRFNQDAHAAARRLDELKAIKNDFLSDVLAEIGQEIIARRDALMEQVRAENALLNGINGVLCHQQFNNFCTNNKGYRVAAKLREGILNVIMTPTEEAVKAAFGRVDALRMTLETDPSASL